MVDGVDPAAWVLSVDFGTTNTVAFVGSGTAEPRELRLPHRSGPQPSAVFLRDEGTTGQRPSLSVGESAVNLALSDPSRYEPAPKRRLGEARVTLGTTPLESWQLAAAVIGHVYAEAVRQHGGSAPAAVAVTHPANWAEPRREALRHAAVEAAAALGHRPWIGLVPEPVAAAWSAGQRLEPGDRIAVFDLGGGTVDVALVERSASGPGFTVVGEPRGLDHLGGRDIDLLLVRHVLEQLGDEEVRRRLERPTDPSARIAALKLQQTCREVKEQLSHEHRFPVYVPPLAPQLPEGWTTSLSRHELEQIAVPLLREATDLLGEVVRSADKPVGQVLMVGGTSRLPVLGAMVQEATGLQPTDFGDPVTAVAEGAARWLRPERVAPDDSADSASAPSPPPPPTTPVSDSPKVPTRRASSRRALLITAGVLVAALVVGGGVWRVAASNSRTGGGAGSSTSLVPPLAQGSGSSSGPPSSSSPGSGADLSSGADPSSGPSSVSGPSSDSTPGSGSSSVAAPDPTGQLLALIPAEVRDCAPAEQPHDDLALASVDCGQSELSPAVTGFAFDLYGSTSDLQSEMDAIIARHPDGVRAIQDCLTSEGNTRWVQGSHGGVMVCGPGTSGLWRIWWTDEAVDVLGEAEVSTNSGADYQALYQWWLDNAALGV